MELPESTICVCEFTVHRSTQRPASSVASLVSHKVRWLASGYCYATSPNSVRACLFALCCCCAFNLGSKDRRCLCGCSFPFWFRVRSHVCPLLCFHRDSNAFHSLLSVSNIFPVSCRPTPHQYSLQHRIKLNCVLYFLSAAGPCVPGVSNTGNPVDNMAIEDSLHFPWKAYFNDTTFQNPDLHTVLSFETLQKCHGQTKCGVNYSTTTLTGTFSLR